MDRRDKDRRAREEQLAAEAGDNHELARAFESAKRCVPSGHVHVHSAHVATRPALYRESAMAAILDELFSTRMPDLDFGIFTAFFSPKDDTAVLRLLVGDRRRPLRIFLPISQSLCYALQDIPEDNTRVAAMLRAGVPLVNRKGKLSEPYPPLRSRL